MKWNWQQPDWPNFSFHSLQIDALEKRLLFNAGLSFGAFKHVGEDDKRQLTVELISNEALKTSEIEGEYLNRDSLQSSICRQFGIPTADQRKIPPAEQGIAEVMVDLYRSFDSALSHDRLFAWHTMLTKGRTDLRDSGRYRTDAEPMQIVSGPVYAPKIHFEAPPAADVPDEMDRFIAWFNNSAPNGNRPLAALTRAGVAHLYFESIHPFEDGNGRIGRAIVEKALAQSLGQPTLIAIAYTIERGKNAYYAALEQANRSNDITEWLVYFSETLLAAQDFTQKWIEFLIQKSRMFGRFGSKLNPRQEKVLLRMFREGPEGFSGGLSAEKYHGVTGAPKATVTRDLQDLVVKGALLRSGERKHTRYYLNFESRVK
ncbi:MAG: Fic family protein [Methylomonas sp.]|jgi:Fic family protein